MVYCDEDWIGLIHWEWQLAIVIIISMSKRQSNYFNRSTLNMHKCQFAVCAYSGVRLFFVSCIYWQHLDLLSVEVHKDVAMLSMLCMVVLRQVYSL